MKLDQIDPSLSLLAKFSKMSGGVSKSIGEMRNAAIFSDGKIAKKEKIAAAIIWAIATKCEPCFKYYVSQAIEAGMGEQELCEYI